MGSFCNQSIGYEGLEVVEPINLPKKMEADGLHATYLECW